MACKRTDRLNSLLKEVISEVLSVDLQHSIASSYLITIMSVDITKDLQQAKIFISVIGDAIVKRSALRALKKMAGPIAYAVSKKMTMRVFPKITFFLDEGLEKQLRICEILEKVAPRSS